MLASRVGRHRLELVVAVCAIAALVAVAASTRTTTQTFARSESWRHATGSLAALTASSHVWLEEIFAGDTGNDPQRDVLAPLGHAHVLCEALRFGGTTPMGRVEPVQPANRARVDALCEDLVRLGTLSRQRLAAPGTSRAGTVMDARYDAVFHRIEDNADGLGNDLAATVRSERASAQHLNAGLLLSLLVIFAAMGVMGRRHVRERLVRQRLEALARTDPLTGLANHRHFHERLRAELDRAGRDGTNLALVVLDLDHFAGLNDRRGHRFGDRVLSEIAVTIGAGVRASDLVARVAGGRFAVLLPGATGRDAAVIADALRARVAEVRPDGCAVTASAGVAAVPTDAIAAAALIEAADGALAWAKRDGRDRTRRYDPAHVRSTSLQQRRAEILALLEGEDTMRPVFQPLVDLETAERGRLRGADPLSRHRPRPRALVRAGPPLRARRPARGACDRPRARRPGPSRGAFLTVNVSPSALLSEEVARALPEDLDGVVVELTENETRGRARPPRAARRPPRARRADRRRRRGRRPRRAPAAHERSARHRQARPRPRRRRRRRPGARRADRVLRRVRPPHRDRRLRRRHRGGLGPRRAVRARRPLRAGLRARRSYRRLARGRRRGGRRARGLGVQLERCGVR